MTPAQKKNYNQMLATLRRISKYQSTNQLRRDSQKDYGLDYEEALEYAYENIQSEAKAGCKGIRTIK